MVICTFLTILSNFKRLAVLFVETYNYFNIYILH